MSYHPLLAPYKPTDADPFDSVKAAHLLNRAGFGGTEPEIEKVMKLGPSGAVEWLLDFPSSGAEIQTPKDVPSLASIDGLPQDFQQLRLMFAGKTPEEKKTLLMQLQASNQKALVATGGWWMRRMAFGPHPLQEKLTLLWHGHFTTSAKDERSALLMWNQNETLRKYAAGNFREFVRQISRDPAMLDYLNNSQNHKEHPNENYARELMELFTLGIGNYTENDVKQSARAFTGWGHDGEKYVFHRFEHDEGIKYFLGYSGNFNGDDIIDIILSQAACPKYIGGKFYRWFVSEDANDAIAAALGRELRDSDWEMRPVLKTLLTSKAFYSPEVVGAQIKSPVQLVVGTIRLLGLDLPPEQALVGALTQMGQVPLMPPNVKGWPGGRMWINTSTLFVRYNTAVWLAGGGMPAINGKVKGFGRFRGEYASVFNPDGGASPEDVVDKWLATLIQRPVDRAQRQQLIDALDDQPDREDKVRKMVQLIVSMPEYELC